VTKSDWELQELINGHSEMLEACPEDKLLHTVYLYIRTRNIYIDALLVKSIQVTIVEHLQLIREALEGLRMELEILTREIASVA
jgi:hypothetical protein